LRDLDGVINPLKKGSGGYRSFDFDVLSKAKIVLTLKAVGFSNKKIIHMFELRQEIIGLLHKLSPGNIDSPVVVRAKNDRDIVEIQNKVHQYRSILSEAFLRIDDMKKIVNIGTDFFNDEDERAKDVLG
jgi:DNA-binding transcriptional MerR regulator